MTRDTKRDEAYFTKHIIECEEDIKKSEKILLELPLGKRETCLFCIVDKKKCIAMDKYSRGDDINLVKKDLEALMLLRQKNRLELGGFDTSDYRGNAIELCVRVLLDMDSACVLELIEEDERKKKDIFNRDWFLHFIGSKGKNLNLERKCNCKEHELIKEFVATKDIEFLHQYMKKHTRLRDPLDTWDLEGAAIVKLMNLDKEEFKNYKYFPYDLI
ncbi:PoNe immunity protein domain-containing protein [Campylobacter coli]|uniref:PoNe immunity protein domain-containing protein n=1 Tax=Campylobacter coli TaxID=195 RepID=UPI00093115B5|nr:PoNe immunity protein domain-containing protein [Campylobacter coli]